MSLPISSEQMHHRFFVVTSGVLLLIVLVGFAPSFYLKLFFEDPGQIVRAAELLQPDGERNVAGPSGLPLHVVAHGTLFTAWMALFFVQTLAAWISTIALLYLVRYSASALITGFPSIAILPPIDEDAEEEEWSEYDEEDEYATGVQVL